MEIWVKVITAHPLKGPCEGQVQFTVDWERRNARKTYDRAGYPTFRFSLGGKKHKWYGEGNYATVKKNFQLVLPSMLVIDWYIIMDDGSRPDLSCFLPSEYNAPLVRNPSHLSYSRASEEEPPTMRKFRCYLADSNADRFYDEEHRHWDPWKLAHTLVPKLFKPYWVKYVQFDGDVDYAYASIFKANGDSLTLYVEPCEAE